MGCNKLSIKAKKILDEWRNGKRTYSGFGIDCKYFEYTKKWGIKLYHNKHKRDKTFFLQSYGYRYKIAPKCFKRFTVKLGSVKWYGYFTQKTRVLSSHRSESFFYKINSQLSKIYKRIKWKQWDIHYTNVGYLNGKLVCIDFGHFKRIYK
jgi:hypothetical protein